MLVSILASLPELRMLLRTATQRQHLLVLEDEALSNIIMVLKPLNDATLLLSASKTPTLHLVFPTKIKLLMQMRDFANNEDLQDEVRDVSIME